MESNRTNPAATILGGLLSGAVVGMFLIRRDIQAGEPSVIDKMKAFESRLYADGERRAVELQQIKQEAKLTAAVEN